MCDKIDMDKPSNDIPSIGQDESSEIRVDPTYNEDVIHGDGIDIFLDGASAVISIFSDRDENEYRNEISSVCAGSIESSDNDDDDEDDE